MAAEYCIEFRAEPEYQGHGYYHEVYRASSWDEACSFVGWERDYDHGRHVRISREGEVLGDPAGIKRLADYGLDEDGYRPDLGQALRGEQLLREYELKARCNQAVCRICHSVGADYRGFYRLGRHRRFAVCPVCGDAVELQEATAD